MANREKWPKTAGIPSILRRIRVFCGKAHAGRSSVLLTSAARLVALSSSEVFSSSFATSGAFSASADMVLVWFWGLSRWKSKMKLGIELL